MTLTTRSVRLSPSFNSTSYETIGAVTTANEPESRKWTVWLLRVTVTLAATLTFSQAVTAGTLLAGHYDMLAVHRDAATITVAVAGLMLITAVLRWRPGHGPLWPALVSLLYLAALVLQTFTGYRRLLAYHIPLATVLIASALLLLVWVWQPTSRRTITPQADPRVLTEHRR